MGRRRYPIAMNRALLASTLLASTLLACACEVPPPPSSSSVAGKSDGLDAVEAAPPWGGSEPSRWQPEAILANAATTALERHGDPDARVAIATHLVDSGVHPFGDGQSNASASLVYWSYPRPPVVAVSARVDGVDTIEIRLDRELPLHDDAIELVLPDGPSLQLDLRTDDHGDRLATTTESRALAASWLLVHPSGWNDAFPVRFEIPVVPVGALVATVPEHQRTLPDGEPIVDPVAAAAPEAAPGSVYRTLRDTSFPPGFINQAPFVSESVHGQVPSGNGLATAVGRAFTWMSVEPFKDLYVCLEGRQLDGESALGVPSGAGWHRIGDPGESLLNSLEGAPLLIAYGRGASVPPIAGGTHAYGLDRVAVFRHLQAGEAFSVPNGDFHWYASRATEACAQIWVHPCAFDPQSPTMTCE